MALFLPWLPAERIVRGGFAPAGATFALVAGNHPRLPITALSCAATRQGLEIGMTLAEARAASPELLVFAQDAEADRALLGELIQLAGRWSAKVVADKASDLPNDFHAARRWGLVLETTDSALNDATALEQVLAAIRTLGLTVAGALGGTADAARALARFGCDNVRALPVAALGLSEDSRISLRRAGLRRIGELADLPRDRMVATLGPELSRRLGRLLSEDLASSRLPGFD